jgi:hypothetical protein
MFLKPCCATHFGAIWPFGDKAVQLLVLTGKGIKVTLAKAKTLF